jgi:hypothetical protein
MLVVGGAVHSVIRTTVDICALLQPYLVGNSILDDPATPPDRHFGSVAAALFAALAALSYVRGGHAYPWLGGMAIVIGGITLAKPHWLHPFNILWMRFAAILHRIVSPVVLGDLLSGPYTRWCLQRLAGRHHASQNRPKRSVLLDLARATRPAARQPVTSSRALHGFSCRVMGFLKVRKKFWLLPIILVMLLIGGLLILGRAP